VEGNLKRVISQVSRRLLLRRLSLSVWRCGLAGGGAALLCLALVKLGGGSPELGRWASALWGAGLLVGLLLGLGGALRPHGAAKLIDDSLGLHDRISSAYSFTSRDEPEGLAALAVQDAAEKAETVRASDVAPRPAWARLVFSVCVLPILIVAVQARLFPPPPEKQVEVFSEAELGAALSAINMAMEDPQTFQQLQQELKKLGIGETTEKKELLARLNRTISELKQQAEEDEGLLTTLAQMEKLKSKLGLAELQMRADEELRQVEDLVTDDGVLAETIFVDPLVDASKAQEIAKGLKEVAERQLGDESGEEPGPEADDRGRPVTDTGDTEKGRGEEPEPGQEGAKPTEKEGDLAIRAITDEAIRERILGAAREADRSSEDYAAVYRNYRRAFLAELFRMNLGSGRREYLERYFYTIRPEKK